MIFCSTQRYSDVNPVCAHVLIELRRNNERSSGRDASISSGCSYSRVMCDNRAVVMAILATMLLGARLRSHGQSSRCQNLPRISVSAPCRQRYQMRPHSRSTSAWTCERVATCRFIVHYAFLMALAASGMMPIRPGASRFRRKAAARFGNDLFAVSPRECEIRLPAQFVTSGLRRDSLASSRATATLGELSCESIPWVDCAHPNDPAPVCSSVRSPESILGSASGPSRNVYANRRAASRWPN